jgi:putative PEP-CTERM system histidine kinase
MSLLPFLWFLFSLLFARQDFRASIARSKSWLAFIGSMAGFFSIVGIYYPFLFLQGGAAAQSKIMVTRAGQWYFLYLIIAAALTMINIESTYRSSWGIYRQKLRAPIIVLGLMLVSLLFSASFVLLSGEISRVLLSVLAGLAALAAIFITVYFLRYEIQRSGVYVRQNAIYSSVAIIIIGFYLVLAGAIGKVIQIIGGDVRLFVSVLGALVAFLALLALVLSGSIRERLTGALNKKFLPGQLDFETELSSFSEDIAILFDPEELTKKLLELFRERLGIGKLYIFYADQNQPALNLHYPKEHPSAAELKLPVQGVFAEWLFRHGEAMVMDDLRARLSSNRNEIPELEKLSELEIAITLPLIAKQKLVGILFLGPKANKEPFGHREIQFISSIGHQFSLALFSARLSEELLAAKQIESFHKFTAFVMHDLKNSVSMLSMLMQNYENNMDNPEFQKSAMTTINGAVARIQGIIQKLRGGESAETFRISDCDLNEIVLSLEDKLGLKKQSGIEYIRELGRVGKMQGDPDKLGEVIRNLMINALEAMPDGGKLVVNTFANGDKIVLQVEDTGEGMSSEFISKKLFKPFSTSKKKGLGIGLYQSKEWVQKMGGKILVKSNPGQGTIFSLHFKKTGMDENA